MNVEKQDKSGLVYILTNPVMPGIVKIGKTKRPEDMIEKRIKELDNTAVPMPFEPFFSLKTVKYDKLEKVIHRELDKLTDTRVRENREFFRIDPELARDLLLNISKLIDDAETCDYGNEAIDDKIDTKGRIKPRSKNTTFSMIGIPINTELIPINDKCPKVIVANDVNLVRLEDGSEDTISNVAVRAMKQQINGFSCYRYKGEKLSDIRKRIDKNYLPSHQK